MKGFKITPSAFRSGVKWLGMLAIFHTAAFILYSLFLSSVLKVRYDYEEYTAAYNTVLVFNLLFWLIIAFVWIVRGEMSHDEVRRRIVSASKEEGFSLIPYFCRMFVMEWVWKTAFFFVLQLPYTIFFANFGLALNDTMIFLEKIYISVAGFYAATGSAILGLLLSSLYFFAVMILCSFAKYALLLKNEL